LQRWDFSQKLKVSMLADAIICKNIMVHHYYKSGTMCTIKNIPPSTLVVALCINLFNFSFVYCSSSDKICKVQKHVDDVHYIFLRQSYNNSMTSIYAILIKILAWHALSILNNSIPTVM
jgi:hypothetical protein